MREGIKRVILPAAIALVAVMAFACVASAAARPIWEGYHRDGFRKGLNNDCEDFGNPASTNLIWVFPRGVGENVDEELSIVDDLDPTYFTPDRTWFTNDTLSAENAWETRFLWKPVSSRASTGYQDRPVRWDLPSELGKGRYTVMIWVPSTYDQAVDENGKPLHRNTTQAEYTVYDSTGATTIKFDQTIGGEWRLLANRQFDFSDGGYVTLSNVTDDTEAAIKNDGIIVAADAIKFVPGTGAEIYASVASGIIPWSTSWEAFSEDLDGDGDQDSVGEGSFSGEIAAVFAATVESPLANSQYAPDSGSVYCINSVTPTVDPIKDITNDDYLGLSRYLGTDIWRYPRPPRMRYQGSEVSGNPVARNYIEGPVEGGFYASPTLAMVNNRMVCFAAGMDRQFYALDAATGELLWKGPGVTISEGTLDGEPKDSQADGGVLTPDSGTSVGVVYADAFGGAYHYVACDVQTDQVFSTWTFTENKRVQLAGQPTDDGLSYAVYAYLPGKSGAEPNQRAVDATYRIYTDQSGSDPEAQVSVNQADPENQGKWVKIGSYFNVTKVELLTHATAHAEGLFASDYVVVADAVQIIPDTIEAFGYCSPIVDLDAASTSIVRPTTVFAASTSGRVIGFDLDASGTQRIGKVRWIFPKVRTSATVSGEADADQPSLGQLAGSPSYFHDTTRGKNLILAGVDGRVHCINNPDAGSIEDPPTDLWAGADPIDPAGFTSSPAIDRGDDGATDDRFFIGATSGKFYAIGLGGDSPEIRWQYPTSGTGLPLGAFRYSTPAIAEVPSSGGGNRHRVWVGGSDSRIYSFDATSGDRLRVEFDNAGNPVSGENEWYIEPSAGSAVQASIAITGQDSNHKRVMFVGDMGDNGVLHWYNAKTGESDWVFNYDNPSDTADAKAYQGWRCEGPLFSSPNITNLRSENGAEFSYVYNGCGDGRVYAFSHHGGAWGGRWAGGRWPFDGGPGGGEQSVVSLAPDTDIQFDIFRDDFYNNSLSFTDTNLKTGTGSEPNIDNWWPDDPNYIVSKGMKWQNYATGGKTDDQIDEDLRNAALDRRTHHVFPNLAARQPSGDDVLYFEWGEKVNMILWNLPGLEYLYGSSEGQKRNNIRFTMTNTSAGTSAGSQVRLSGAVKLLREYTVLSNETDTSTTSGGESTTIYKPLQYSATGEHKGADVKRSYAVAQIDIRGTGSNPPSPGPGWVVNVEIRRKTSNDDKAPIVLQTMPLARLSAGNPPEPVTTSGSQTNANIVNFKEQLVGINNPLAIKTVAIAGNPNGAGWPQTLNYRADRSQTDAHYNGNGIYDPTGEGSLTLNSPLDLDVGTVGHGTSSPVISMGVMDRSATGLGFSSGRQTTLDRFRISGGDLRWPGNADVALSGSGGIKFAWELGFYSADYPPIYKRFETFRKNYDDADPSRAASKLPPLLRPATGVYDDAILRPDVCQVSVEVPRFQPANIDNHGYRREMQAYIDSNGNGQFDSGNVVSGRPTTYQECFRQFAMKVKVPPDPRIEVDEQLVDIGQASHGTGQNLHLIPFLDFMPGNPNPEIRQWFKRITVKNAGNVNLYNLHIGDNAHGLFMLKDPRGFTPAALAATPVIPGNYVCSSLDTYAPSTPSLQGLKAEPFFTGIYGNAPNLGYTLTKARVGDPDPTILTVPDRRKWDADFLGTRLAAQNAYGVALAAQGFSTENVPKMQPFGVEVGVGIPIGQPIGTYQAPYIPVYANFGSGTQTVRSDPSFGLKVTVREIQLTGTRTPGSLAHVDAENFDNKFARFGDETPAAYRDAAGQIQFFWSSNRMFDPSLFPDPSLPPDSRQWRDFASAPWLIDQSTLGWNRNWWATSPDSRWWNTLGSVLNTTTKQWPSELLGSDMKDAYVLPWTFGGDSTDLLSVRHFSPTIAQNLDVAPTQPFSTVLAWAGTADIQMPDGKLAQESRIFYTNAATPDVTSSSQSIDFIPLDPTMEKRSPSLSLYNQGSSPLMWAFWLGGAAGKWSICYAVNEQHAFPNTGWEAGGSFRLRTPDCLATLSSPNAIHRMFWADLTGDSPNAAGAHSMFDVVYAGSNKVNQAADIILGRYAAVPPSDTTFSAASPASVAQPMPRSFGETLQRDPKFGFYSSEHLAWVRLNPTAIAAGAQMPGLDDWGNYSWADPNADMPFIRVYFPDDYTDPTTGHVLITKGGSVSGTDGCVRDASGNITYDPGALSLELNAGSNTFRLQIDQATGVYTYKYPDNSLTKRLLGDMLVDFSAGVVRFTEPLREVKNPADNTVNAPQVKADYTPLSWRLTTDPAVDNSARSFIERTRMTPAGNPGMTSAKFADMSVDRMWVLWRRAGAAVQSSTIYWKTYRVGIDLAKLGKPPIPMNPDGTVAANAEVSISGNLGPWEIDRTGTRIFFSQVDERYRSLFKSDTTNLLKSSPAPPSRVWSGAPNPITISYKPAGSSGSVTAEAYDVFWLNELGEQSLFGYVGNASVNEGSVYAFADPGDPGQPGPPYSKVWVFWTTTRGGTSDVCCAVLSPNFSAR